MHDAAVVEGIRRKFSSLRPVMNERVRRHWAAAEAVALARGGISAVARATGMSRNTIRVGIGELQRRGGPKAAPAMTSVRRPGGGSKPLVRTDPAIVRALDELVAPETRGDPMSPLRWTLKSTSKLAAELTGRGHPVSARAVAALLKASDYSLQGNRKTREGATHADRDAQFRHINTRVAATQASGQPVVSVDAKKKELVGDFKNGGREWQPKGRPEEVRVYDFIDRAPDKGRVTPYGVYDLTANEGWVSVGTDHDTARFAAQTILKWWKEMGRARYPEATELLITADGGGSNSSRCRLWKVALQELADATGLTLNVSHFPPGTSKWNKIEHRLFCHVTQNWRGKPLVSHDLIVKLIGSTTTSTGLKVKAALDTDRYESGIKVTDDELSAVRITRDEFHGEWNYSISPNASIE
jgi:Rhodopirellula transposase DDE domain